MQFSKSTDYALHALVYLAHLDRLSNVGIKEISTMLNVSESYLSKIMTRLRKDGIVGAVSGVKGGYELARPAKEITFLEVIWAIEGRQRMFECSNLNSQQHKLLGEEHDKPKNSSNQECQIKKVMAGAEQHLYHYLREHTIQSVLDTASTDCSYSIAEN
ncbi:RrF2 family transcriptional regulator [Paenibacillus lutrae]|uniref:Rrf2 family transcriptional regulator n=1 Tax=Paenibacillus lutrae TaxID=2078573 RepID=A0A7X3FEP3_9BACL|nr:Rrf2 family transcriptional regulator [Paenibacillus lutrae]MVO98244.1 Rrf2 family transcriptional regulator [Paenibacillus lutrae]